MGVGAEGGGRGVLSCRTVVGLPHRVVVWLHNSFHNNEDRENRGGGGDLLCSVKRIYTLLLLEAKRHPSHSLLHVFFLPFRCCNLSIFTLAYYELSSPELVVALTCFLRKPWPHVSTPPSTPSCNKDFHHIFLLARGLSALPRRNHV